MRKCILGACLAAWAVAVVLPASAGASHAATRLTIKIKATGNGFRGEVKSRRASCVTHRKVTLQRRKAGQDNFTGLGSDGASNDGIWMIQTKPVDRAEYRAVIKTKTGANGCFPITTEATKAHKTSVSVATASSNLHGKVS